MDIRPSEIGRVIAAPARVATVLGSSISGDWHDRSDGQQHHEYEGYQYSSHRSPPREVLFANSAANLTKADPGINT